MLKNKNRRLRRAFPFLPFLLTPPRRAPLSKSLRAAPDTNQPLTPIRICGGYGYLMAFCQSRHRARIVGMRLRGCSMVSGEEPLEGLLEAGLKPLGGGRFGADCFFVGGGLRGLWGPLGPPRGLWGPLGTWAPGPLSGIRASFGPESSDFLFAVLPLDLKVVAFPMYFHGFRPPQKSREKTRHAPGDFGRRASNLLK